jgi:hypothetical protein
MMGQQQQAVAEQAGGALRRMILALGTAALMAVMMVAMAAPASATAPNCERGQAEAFLAQAFNESTNDNPERHTSKLLGCAAP